MWQTDGTAHKLKPRSFHKSIHLQAYPMDFHLLCELHLTRCRYRTMFCIFSNFIYSLSFSYFSYFWKKSKKLKNSSFIPVFYRQWTFHLPRKSLEKTNLHLFCSYNIISLLLEYFGLVIEHGKSEVFHFSRSHEVFNPSLLDLSCFGGSILKPKDIWKYLGFIFNKKLSFWQHVKFYFNKVLSTVKYMKMLGNFTWGLFPQ